MTLDKELTHLYEFETKCISGSCSLQDEQLLFLLKNGLVLTYGSCSSALEHIAFAIKATAVFMICVRNVEIGSMPSEKFLCRKVECPNSFFFLIKSFKLYRCELSNNMDIVKTKRGIHSVLNFFHMLLVSQIW